MIFCGPYIHLLVALPYDALIKITHGAVVTERVDISDLDIHWIKGDTHEEAFDTLMSIVQDRFLQGSNRGVRSGSYCVSFTEAPECEFLKSAKAPAYQPFGVAVSKKWLFKQGGRPVIYQPDEECSMLSKEIQWRHVKYDPLQQNSTGYAWQREWRIPFNQLPLPADETTLVVPDEGWYRHLVGSFKDNEAAISNYANAMAGTWVMSPDNFPYLNLKVLDTV